MSKAHYTEKCVAGFFYFTIPLLPIRLWIYRTAPGNDLEVQVKTLLSLAENLTA